MNIENLGVCINRECDQFGEVVDVEGQAVQLCKFCGTATRRLKHMLRIPNPPLRIVRPTAPTTYKADGTFVDLGILDEMEVTA